jgi:hypothetical protein
MISYWDGSIYRRLDSLYLLSICLTSTLTSMRNRWHVLVEKLIHESPGSSAPATNLKLSIYHCRCCYLANIPSPAAEPSQSPFVLVPCLISANGPQGLRHRRARQERGLKSEARKAAIQNCHVRWNRHRKRRRMTLKKVVSALTRWLYNRGNLKVCRFLLTNDHGCANNFVFKY